MTKIVVNVRRNSGVEQVVEPRETIAEQSERRRKDLRAVAVLVALGLVGCVHRPINEEVDAPEGADAALEMIVQEWSDILDVDISASDVPTITWYAPYEGRDCIMYSETMENCKYGAFLWSPFEEQIYLIRKPTLHQSGMAHEVLHWHLWSRGAGPGWVSGDADDGHSLPEWDGVPEVNLRLAEAGL